MHKLRHPNRNYYNRERERMSEKLTQNVKERNQTKIRNCIVIKLLAQNEKLNITIACNSIHTESC